ncbi:hypothetical protein GCM10010912_60200 [Paenibacillus albidus]|uniref:Response regulator n=1 Tax=Paenibacillus albidus TaxID=2041023 RepID=A0A917D262_9BACL|nr:response regulator [Paenibacillus albidus]GGG07521.1 hypothetical protein GCM10010912_60200 [Paenibacillus albidus]
MLRIVIVDDEILIREGLARMIGKESSRFQVVGTYADGQQVLDELPELQIDVVITDIRMPQVDGLELIKRLKASHPQIRSLLMSGFVEFNYAREAIRSSAVDYLLKPINKEQLFEILYRLDEERAKQQAKEERQRSGLLLSLLHMEEPSSLLLTGLTLPQPYFTVILLKGSRPEVVCTCIDSLRQEKAAVFDQLAVLNGQQMLIWYSMELLRADELQGIAAEIHSYSPGDILHVGTSCSYTDPAKLKTAYLEAKRACDTGIYYSGNLHYANIQEIRPPGSGQLDAFIATREALVHELQILNVPGVMEWIHGLFAALKSTQADGELILQACRMIQETTAKEIQEFEAVYGCYGSAKLAEQIAGIMTFGGIEQCFISAFSAALSEIRNHRLTMSGTAVESVKRWVAANYNQPAELNALAGMVFLTPSYLSKLFKQETGHTLTDYIIEIRIRAAKQLLKNAPDLKVHEIGAQVGYADPAYFNKLFKRVVGVTPNEYKRISIH